MTKSPSMKHLDRLLGKSEALVIGSPKINSNIQIGLKYFARNLLKEFLNNKPFKLGRQKTKSNFLSSITNNKSNKCPNIEIKKTLKSVQKLFRVELEIQLRYMNDNLSLNSIYLISKPSRRIFTSNKNLNKLTYFYNKKYNKKSLGLVIISTSQGFLTNQQAFKAKLGGEVICIVF
jgi:ribosomal protein S8